MVPGAVKRRTVDLDFYLHRIFRKTSFRFVRQRTVRSTARVEENTNALFTDHCSER